MVKKSIMWEYIDEETAVLKNILLHDDVQKVIDKIDKGIEAVYFVSHGSSNNAAVAVSNFLAHYAKIRVYCYTPANILYNCATLDYEKRSKSLVISISQTGTSRGTLEAVEKVKSLGFPVLGITNVKNSPLDKLADISLLLNCGEECSNAKTKGYSATLMVLLCLSLAIARKKGYMTLAEANNITSELNDSVDELSNIAEKTVKWCEMTKFGKNIENIFVLGYGMNYGTALEGQLKLMETMCIPTMFNDMEEFSHGMHRAINKDSSVILINTEHHCKDLTNKTFSYLQGKTDKLLMINASEDEFANQKIISIKNHPLTQSILGITLVIQILSVAIPELNGMDPNVDANNDYTECMKTRIDSCQAV